MKVAEQESSTALAKSLENEWYKQATVVEQEQVKGLRMEFLAGASIHPCCPYTKVDAPINPPKR